ncbi:uncharacterized protein STAUR_0530 [Stigmatella aurantiaca DW4/3-1]|uniref:Uncharacterized protein n=1 Tax=Stigmatella aurantiaca (strain DW4/3-1) TaxID=378806 RepID=E3FTC0_STIAD|nr:uncharacterized protein STAUR_0530 [Stigmatella aurantiaca DW4/3-1]
MDGTERLHCTLTGKATPPGSASGPVFGSREDGKEGRLIPPREGLRRRIPPSYSWLLPPACGRLAAHDSQSARSRQTSRSGTACL